MGKTGRLAAAGLVSFGLIASACGSSDGGGTASETTAAATATTAASAATTAAAGGTETTAAATTVASGEKYGKQADGTYLGKGGFTIDPKNCPSDWDIDQGITDTEIKLFMSLPKSGPLAGFGLIYDGANSYFKYLADSGQNPGGRAIVVDSKDDVYQADKTKANVDEAIASNSYAGLFVTLGTPNNLAVWDTTNKECMPQLLNGTGAAQWGDVENHPWTTGMQIDYTTEAQLWVEWMKKEFPSGAKVASITFNNDFGKSYAKGLKAGLKGTNLTLVLDELHEANAPNLTNQFTNIEAEKPDVIVIQTSGAFCTQAMAEIEKRALTSKVMISATCGSLSQFFKPLIDQGLTGKDTYIIQYIKDVNDAEFAADPFVKLYQETLPKQGLDPKQSTYATGWVFAWFMAAIVEEASTYEGGLNRANLMLAARGIEETMPLMIDGVTNKMNGLEDAYLNEAGRVAQYKVTDPKALGTFVKYSEVINNEGKLGTYAKFQAIAGE